MIQSARDTALVARFELLRAVRTWRALALVVLYFVASTGGAWLFVRFIGLMENQLADTLGVPATETPGAMLDRLVESDGYRRLLNAMIGSDQLVDALIQTPTLAIFHLWLGLLLVPFFAASASAECISIDMRSRALRFEALRTGRLELVFGRFAGQVLLTGVASFAAVSGVWGVGLWFMVGNEPVELGLALLGLTFKAWMFGLPFVGIGVACSQLTLSPAWARVLAVGVTAGTWVGFGIARWGEDTQFAILSDIAMQLLPQGWMRGLWEPGLGWLPSAGVCGALAISAMTLGYLRFATRDL